MYLNSEELLSIAFDEIEAAVDADAEDDEIVSRIRGVLGFVHRMREKKEKEKT